MTEKQTGFGIFRVNTLLTALVVLCFCGFFAFVFFLVQQHENERQLVAIKHAEKADAIYSAWRNGQLTAAKMLASRPEFTRLLHSPNTPLLREPTVVLLEQVHASTQDLYSYIAIVRISKLNQDVTGVFSLPEVEMVADSIGGGSSRYNAESDIALHAMFRTGQIKRGPVRYENGIPFCFTLAVPLHDGEGNIAGALNLGIRLESLRYALMQAEFSESDHELMAVDSSGKIIFSTVEHNAFTYGSFGAKALLPYMNNVGVSSFIRMVDDAPREFFAKAVDSDISGADSWWFVVQKPAWTRVDTLRLLRIPLALSGLALVLCLFLGWPKKTPKKHPLPLAQGITHPLLATSPLVFVLCNTETGTITATSKNARRLFDCYPSELTNKPLRDFFVSRVPEKNGLHDISIRTKRDTIVNLPCICHRLRSPEVLLYIDDSRTDSKQKEHVRHLTTELAAAVHTAGILRAEAQQTLHGKGAFIFGLCSSLRENMDHLHGLLHLLENSNLTASQASYLQKATETNARLFSTLNATLEFSRLEHGEMRLEAHPFYPSKLLVTVFESYKGRAAENNLHVLIKYDHAIPQPLKGDAARLKQVLKELLEFFVCTAKNGAILLNCRLLSTDEKSAALGFTVSNKDLVLSAEDRDTFFAPFAFLECLPPNVAPDITLALARHTVFSMRGIMEMTSTPEHGTAVNFICHLPLSDDDTATTLPHDSPHIPNRYSLLVAEKNAITRNVLLDTLEHSGSSVVAVSTGADVMSALENPSWAFNALLINLELPDMDAYALVRKIRESHLASALPIIALNAQPTPEQRIRAFITGINDIVENPLDSNSLYETIRRWVEACHRGG